MTIAIGTVVVAQQVTERELHSAHPDAPRVAQAVEPDWPGLRRTRRRRHRRRETPWVHTIPAGSSEA